MPRRIRSIKPSFFEDEKLAKASDQARLMAVTLISLADDEGRGRGAVEVLATEAWKYHLGTAVAKTVAACDELSHIGFVKFYEHDGERLYFIPKFLKHQNINRPTKSVFPPFAGGITEGSVRPHGGISVGEEGRGGERITRAPAAVPEVRSALPLARLASRTYAQNFERVRKDAWMLHDRYQREFTDIGKNSKSEKEVTEGISRFFESNDSFVISSDYSPSLLAKQWHKWKCPPPKSAQERDNSQTVDPATWVFDPKREPAMTHPMRRKWEHLNNEYLLRKTGGQ